MTDCVYLGVDVGTGSARAGVFDATGRMLASASREIRMWRPEPEWAEQSTADIWRAVCESVRAAVGGSGARAEEVRGIGFDATCSLVVLDARDGPVSVSPEGDDERNVIVWMDHRALGEAARINAIGHEVLKYVGGRVSPEMQSPKLLWLKENLPGSWHRAARFFDLADFLTYRSTGDETRSLCTTVCKWTYLGHEEARVEGSVGRWDDSYWRAIGLGELVDESCARIGRRVRPMGEPVGKGLTREAAEALGLAPGTPVGVGIIDAHAGGIGLLGAPLAGGAPTPDALERRLALIAGTSSCHMAASREPHFVPGVWGPYFSAMVPGMWLTEGGQSASGSLVDHAIASHARGAELIERASREGRTAQEILNARLDALAGEKGLAHRALLARELHVLPYHHGNRSPRADATLRGMASGLRLSDTLDDLALLYLATVQAVAFGTRHIIDTMNAHGHRIETILACGGGARNALLLRAHADATGLPVVLPREPEAVLLGSAILGAAVSGDFGGGAAPGAGGAILAAMVAMCAAGEVVEPAGGDVARFHAAKYAVFLRMYEDQVAYRGVMARALPAPRAH